ncbi:MAG: exodeoxyribonuclease VII small subunit [Luminiphilus sp.]|jgi:exodeoxyribonuclease VII small subunit|nr:exodeoxyribonuclease VII small subunit [Halieaceae bacterium]MBL6698101.1 exodeoxyribonuclease VII small subunit [Luminiphilus sp.]MBL6897208.1 exodeoxyribonuclease VII small subunit [Luminiphilus sp.]MBT6351492.1 exodeoxyribonuclease VII small subunit [Halieaceae bacterium]|tara:strand:- start:7880 stop:8074 length:195 start_codon:yes stop_codon:yes gene_type:complete
MTELGELVEQLENPEIELETALKLYEEGVKLSSTIQKTLEDAEQRIVQVTQDGLVQEEDLSEEQ